MACCLAVLPATAAPVQLPGAVQPGHERQVPQAPPPPPVDFSIVAPQRSPVPRDVDQIKFKLVALKIEGATTIPADTFTPLYAGLIGQQVTLPDILNVADGIEKAYRDRGYLLVRAYVPPQHVSDGVFTIKVVEGFVSNIVVDGGPQATRDQVRDYMRAVVNQRPLRLETIERALLLANDLPGVTASGVLRPSPDVPGASELAVTVAEPDLTGSLSSDNRGSRFSGIWTVTGAAEYNSIFGDDAFDVSLTAAPHSLEQIGGQARYRTAIGSDGLIGSAIVAVTHGAPGFTLGIVNTKTDSWAAGPRLSYPLIRTRAATLSLDGGLTAQEAKINILGQPISDDKWRVADLALTYSSNEFLGGTFDSTIDLAQGIPGLGASSRNSPLLSRPGAPLDFTKLTGFARYTAFLGASPFSFSLAGQGQYAFEPLITGEQILFGGTQIGRGYDPGAITGDHGLGGSAELRYNTQLNDLWIQSLQPYAFFDAARTLYRDRTAITGSTLNNYTIESAGAGVRFWFPYNIYWDVEVARTLKAVPGSDNGTRTTKLLTDISISF